MVWVLLYAPSHRQDSTYHGLCYTSRGALAGTRNSSMGAVHEGSIRRPITPWANALTTELHLAPSHRQDNIYHNLCYTSRGAHLLEREIAQWVHPMKDRSDDPSHHERTLLPRIYISLPPTDRITHTTTFVTPVVEHWLEQEIAHEGSIRRPIAPRANALTTELHLAPLCS